MKNLIRSFSLASLLVLAVVSGCSRHAESTDMQAPVTPTAPDKPDAPEKPAAPEKPTASENAPSASTQPNPSAAAGNTEASIGANGTEARAGDVSVKLPN